MAFQRRTGGLKQPPRTSRVQHPPDHLHVDADGAKSRNPPSEPAPICEYLGIHTVSARYPSTYACLVPSMTRSLLMGYHVT